MRPILLTALILAATLACLAGPVPAQSPAPDWREGFRAHDRNGDGRIDRAELRKQMQQ